MDDMLTALARHQGGFVARPQILSLGYHDRDIREALRRGLWVRVRVGCYAPGPWYRSLTPEQRHVVAAHTAIRRLGPGTVLSHVTALVVQGVAVSGMDLRAVHVVRLDESAGRHESGVVHHRRPEACDVDVVMVQGLPCVAVPLALRQACARTDRRRSVAMVDSALHLGKTDEQELDELVVVTEHWPNGASFRLVVAQADGRAETPGESFVRVDCHTFEVPRPGLQRIVVDEDGVAGRVDFDWLDGRHLGEFDGLIKYGRLVPRGEVPSDVVVREKLREDRLRRTGAGFTRFVWDDLRPATVGTTMARLAQSIADSRRLYVPGWSADDRLGGPGSTT